MANWDQSALFWINGYHNPALDALFVAIAVAGEAWAWVGALLLLALWTRGEVRRTLLVLAVAIAVAEALIKFPLGHWVHRERPYLAVEGIRQLGIAWKDNSFPSGHAMNAWLATVFLGAHYRRLLPWLVGFAVLVCYSRPYLGMHYPTDVLAGAALGTAAGFTALALECRLWPPSKEESTPKEGTK